MRRHAQGIIFALLLLTAALVVGSYVSNLNTPLAQVSLPTLDDDAASGDSDPQSDLLGNFERIPVTITPQTVQAAIKTLARPASYERHIAIETFWETGESYSEASVWVDQGYTAITLASDSGTLLYSVTDGETIYQWYEGDSKYLQGPADEKSADLAGRIPTYEDILVVDLEQIITVSYVSWNGLSCIYTEVAVDELGYRERYWVSVPTGLLVCAETVKGGSVVYRMSSYAMNQPASERRLLLPDGTHLNGDT